MLYGIESLRLPIAKLRSAGNHQRTHIHGPTMLLLPLKPLTMISCQRGGECLIGEGFGDSTKD